MNKKTLLKEQIQEIRNIIGKNVQLLSPKDLELVFGWSRTKVENMIKQERQCKKNGKELPSAVIPSCQVGGNRYYSIFVLANHMIGAHDGKTA